MPEASNSPEKKVFGGRLYYLLERVFFVEDE
jgi:hypothetical protein